MSVSNIPEKVKIRLWGKAAGRCEYEGCNKPLWMDSLTKAEFNVAYIAHIIADQPYGPRGDVDKSDKLKWNISNMMLMCDEHHRLIDKEDIQGHPVERLREMKSKHETRIEMLTSISEDKQSHVILYGANVGRQSAPLSYKKSSFAMSPERYPAEGNAIELSLKNSTFQDHEKKYWDIEIEHLRRQYESKIGQRLAYGDIQHLSIFAIAPQPLLMEFGRLLSDIPSADVYQLHREPPNWKWQGHSQEFNYFITEPDSYDRTPVLNLSLSATINTDRISKVMNEPYSLWKMTIDHPNNDFMKSRLQLEMFRIEFRKLLNHIKTKHRESAVIHLFPAVPVSIAIEIGRVRMPKADMPLIIYDQSNKAGKFIEAIQIPGGLNE